jgi:hypothetical protein
MKPLILAVPSIPFSKEDVVTFPSDRNVNSWSQHASSDLLYCHLKHKVVSYICIKVKEIIIMLSNKRDSTNLPECFVEF